MSGSSCDRRVLMVGIDGGTWSLLDRFMADGVMPKLAALLDRGCRGVLNSVYPPLTPAAWATVLTGKDPGGHGIFDFRQVPPAFAHSAPVCARFVSSRLLPRPYLYDLVGNAGKRIVSINVPMTYPPHPINGLMITGMFTPGNAPCTWPPELQKELGDYEIDLRPGEGPLLAQWLFREQRLQEYTPDALVCGCRRVLGKRRATVLRLMNEASWDLFFVVFTTPDRICHHFWRELSKDGRPQAGGLRDDLLRFYGELDDAIAEVVEATGPNTSVVFLSDHGFGAYATKRVNVQLWLEKAGLSFRKRLSAIGLLRRMPGSALLRRTVKNLLRRCLPAKTAENLIQDVLGGRGAVNSTTDDAKTLVKLRSCVIDTCGFDINPDLAPPDSERHQQLRRELIQGLLEMKDPDSGQLVFEAAFRREEVYHGRYVGDAADVIAVLNPDYTAEADVWSDRVVTPLIHPSGQGNHRREGIFALVGSQASRGPLPPAALEDIAPTVLYLLGLPIPDDMTGNVIEAAFETSCIREHPPIRRPAKTTQSNDLAEGVYSEEEAAEIEQRLKDIGYL